MTVFPYIPANTRSISQRKSIFGVGINDSTYLTNIKINGVIHKCPFLSEMERNVGTVLFG